MPKVKTSKGVIKLDPKDNLLDVLLVTGHDVNYQCREGYCGSCRVKATPADNVTYKKVPLAMISDDEILPCCCEVNQNIIIDI